VQAVVVVLGLSAVMVRHRLVVMVAQVWRHQFQDLPLLMQAAVVEPDIQTLRVQAAQAAVEMELQAVPVGLALQIEVAAVAA
jgi:hypothetical protein